jgi:putative 4-mercaptohistidine N1-methyltranferase
MEQPDATASVNGTYEQDASLAQYLLLHYGADKDVLPYPDGPVAALSYPERCVRALLDPAALPAEARVLDVGCAVGRSTFELARYCAEAIGIDRSERFIQTAQALARDGSVLFHRVDEGDIRTSTRFSVPDRLPRERARFETADACALPDALGSFDVVFNANLIDRLPNPRAFLDRARDLVKPGGQFILTSPFTWTEEFTPRSNWIGGTVRDGTPVRTWNALCRMLDKNFLLAREMDLPFLIREHARKYQWSVARGGRWVRRGPARE